MLALSQGIDMDLIRAQDRFNSGVRAFYEGSLNQSIMYFEKALTFKPQNITERIWLGRALYKSGLEEAALNEWNSVLRRGKGTPILENMVSTINSRRGLVRELFDENRFIVSSVIDAAKNNYLQFKRPTSVRARKDGLIYIVAFGTNEILLVDPNNVVVNVLRGGLEGFDHPFDILEVPDGSLYVSEYEGNKISKCDKHGNKLKAIGKKGTKDGELLGPQFLATDGIGYMYVTDYGNRRVSKFDLDGNFILSFGKKDAGFEGFSGPTGIAVSGEKVYVADSIQKQIAVFDTSGNFIEKIGREFLKGPEGLCFSSDRTLFVADSQPFTDTTRICKLDTVNEKWQVFSDLSSQAKKLLNIAIDPNSDLFACDYTLNKVFTVSEVSELYSGIFAQIEKIDARDFPDIVVDISCEDRFGNPVLGLRKENFLFTESLKPVDRFLMFQPLAVIPKLEIVILVEKSDKMAQFEKDVREAARRIIELAGSDSGVIVVSVSDKAVVEAESDFPKLKKLDSVSNGIYSDSWQFDTGAKLAASKLIPYRLRRAIIFLTEGSLEEGRHFKDYSLTETAQYMKNNFIRFQTVSFAQDGKVSEDLGYLTSQTGGNTYAFYSPESVQTIISDLLEKTDPRYVVRYRSQADTGFGKDFIPVETEVKFRGRSGRDESGYFGPIK
jgi:DNA-binding beta-propeller fold protein YncE